MGFISGRSASLAACICLSLFAGRLPATAQTAAQDAVERGKYLVTIGICVSCHTPVDADGKRVSSRYLAGGAKVGGLNTPNLTSDGETGLGNWTDQQIMEAIRNGKRPDGSTVRPPMGVLFYRDISDVDLRAIVAFLRTVPAIDNKVERLPSRGPDPVYQPVANVGEPDRADAKAYGKYLAQTVAHCFQCHTPRKDGRPDLTRLGAGGNTYNAPGGGAVVASNITPSRLASWTDDQIKRAITKGVRADGGQLVPVMDFDLYDRMTPEDLNLLIGYLRTIEPVAEP
jgi:mono/diheme cytochrome c family protein